MGYTKTTWVAGSAPGISAERLNNLETQYTNATNVGEIRMWTTTTAPLNYLMCDGSSYNAGTYAALFAVTSYRFGGSLSTFKVPNMGGKFPVGYSGAGDYATVGTAAGTSGVALSATYLPSLLTTGIALSWGYIPYGNAAYCVEYYSGSGEQHENRPPFVALNFIIRYQ
jgi:microcystin-dependent protein